MPGFLVALALHGFTEADELRLRFVLEATRLREAAALAATLRQIDRATVHVRPAAPPVFARRWTVTMTLAPVPLTAMWTLERRVRAAVAAHAGCGLLSARPMLGGGDAGRIAGADDWPVARNGCRRP
jgi:uncharacterized membrane protein